jgi:hypothetical protein
MYLPPSPAAGNANCNVRSSAAEDSGSYKDSGSYN